MESISKIKHFSKKALSYIIRHCPLSRYIPDRIYLNWLYSICITGDKMTDYKTFNAKIQWLKMFNRNPLHTTMVDKYAVKELVRERIGEEYVIPVLGIWNHFDEIDFDSLPEKFVLKTTHGGGGIDVVVVRDKSRLDKKSARKKLENSLKKSLWSMYREWPYKDVPRKIIAEQYMEDENGELRDYKFFCMDGIPRFLFVATGRMSSGEVAFDFFDIEFNHLPIKYGHPNMKGEIKPPKNYNKMVELAKILSQGEKFVRVDLYNIRGKIYFGEYTFFSNSGLVPFEPDKWNYIFGEMIRL